MKKCGIFLSFHISDKHNIRKIQVNGWKSHRINQKNHTFFLRFFVCRRTFRPRVIFKLQSPRFFRQIVQFQVIKNLLKKSKIRKKNFGSYSKNEFGALILGFLSVLPRTMGQNESFSNLSNSRFRSLIALIQRIQLRKREFDRLEETRHFY